MAEKLPTQLDAYLESPVLWVQLAANYAETGESPAEELEKGLSEQDRPIIETPGDARKAFWHLLEQPLRHLGIQWLDKMGLLEELIPCWRGIASRRKLRLAALEEVHKEQWREGLDEEVFSAICDVHDVVVDHRLQRWSLTALATLLGGGDTENQYSWSHAVRRDLHLLGATEAELVWIERIIREVIPAMLTLRGEEPVQKHEFRPEVAIAALSTLKAQGVPGFADIVSKANELLKQFINPIDKTEN